MSKPPSLVRNLLAVATIATLWSMPVKSQAGDQLVVVGSIDDMVAIAHPAPNYPYDAQRMRIEGQVEVRIQVEHGRMVKVVAVSNSPYLAGVSERWVRRNWKFRPTISGDYTLPIVYQLADPICSPAV
jgi:outer membrane biosynthesis protein TonB